MNIMEDKLNRLKSILAEVYDLDRAAQLLSWDQQTYMPPAGAKARGFQRGTLKKLAHIMLTSNEVGRLLDELQPYSQGLPPDSDEARLVKVTRRKYENKVKVPPELVAEQAQLVAAALSAWEQAKPENDFAKFLPHLERVIENRQRYAGYLAPYEHVYDPLLDEYEPGMKTAEVKAIFETLRPQQVALLQEIAARPQVDDSFLFQSFDPQKQWDFGVEVITAFGYDWKRGRQDRSAHPFTSGHALDDVRITTRLLPDFMNTALFGTMHEAGHALYSLGFDRSLERSLLAMGASLAIHESQSRMWENLVGRSLPFWEYFYPRLQTYFPAQLANVDLLTFYRGINRVKPSLIRVEADEATYNLHIMLRLELEIALLEGSLEARNLPEAWNARLQEYLGLTPPTDREGVLQDIHWADGLFGYFSTYALGNLISVQLWQRIETDIPDLPDQIRRGQFAALLAWLRQNVHRSGAKFEPQELVQRATGARIDPAPYIQYLRGKYTGIYGL